MIVKIPIVIIKIPAVEPLYNGHSWTRYFWPHLLQYRGFSLSEVKNLLVKPFGNKILSLLWRFFLFCP